jgi:hypothetical protein
MERIQNTDTAYQDDSKPVPSVPPRFTKGAARRARQVVALRPDFKRPFRQLWASLGTGTQRTRLLGGIVLVALAGGVAGGLLAAANKDHRRRMDAGSLTAGAEAKSQTDNTQPVSRSKESEPTSQPANREPSAEFVGPGMERAVVELRKRRSPSRARKAYRVAIIYPGDNDDFGRERKPGRKH